MEVIKLIQKNIKILFRTRISSIIVLFGPLLIILLAGLAFNNSASYNIKIGTFSESYSPTSELFIEGLKLDFEVTQFSSQETCISGIERGYHSCIIIPPNLTITEGDIKKIDFYIDNSKVNIASYIEQKLYENLKEISSQISSELTGELVATTLTTKEEISSDKAKINTEIERLKIAKSKIDNSKSLSEDSDLSFNTNNLELNALVTSASYAKNEFDEIEGVASDALSEYESTVNDITNLSISNSALNSELSNANDEIDSLTTKMTAFSANTSHITNIARISSKINSEIESVEESLENARKNKIDIESNLVKTSSDITTAQENLNEVQKSFDRILASVEGNDVLTTENIVTPVDLEKHHIVSGSGLNHMFPNLIILVLMILSLTMAASQTIQDRLSKANMRILMTPTSFNKRLLAGFFTNMILIVVQLALILVAIHYVFHIDVFSSILAIMSVLLIITIFFTLLGIIIGYVFNSEQTTLLGSVSIASFFFIVSDLILPLESMPQYMIEIVSKTPFVLGTDLLRRVMFFGAGISVENHRILILYSAVLVLAILIWNTIRSIIRKNKAKRTLK